MFIQRFSSYVKDIFYLFGEEGIENWFMIFKESLGIENWEFIGTNGHWLWKCWKYCLDKIWKLNISVPGGGFFVVDEDVSKM